MKSPLTLLLAAAALTACKTTDDANAFDTETDGPGINVTSVEKQFGLDYTFDAESGQMTREGSQDFRKSDFNPGQSSFKTSDYVNKLNGYQPGKYNANGKNLDPGQAEKRGTFETFTSRLAGKKPRGTGDAYDTGSDPLSNDSRAYSTSPYRRAAQRMQSDRYRATAESQANNNRPPESYTRTQRPGDAGVIVNKKGGDVPTVDDIADLLKRN